MPSTVIITVISQKLIHELFMLGLQPTFCGWLLDLLSLVQDLLSLALDLLILVLDLP